MFDSLLIASLTSSLMNSFGLVLYASKETIAAKLLSNKLLVGIGLISYSAYLWHQPLFAFSKIRYQENLSELRKYGFNEYDNDKILNKIQELQKYTQ